MSGTKVETPKPGAGYGCYHMESGQKLDVPKDHITEVSKNEPTIWFLDIICTPNQMQTAQANASYLTGFISGLNESMPLDNIIVAVTVDYMDRPAWTMLQQLMGGSAAPSEWAIKAKEGRRYTYIGGKLWEK